MPVPVLVLVIVLVIVLAIDQRCPNVCNCFFVRGLFPEKQIPDGQ